MIGKLKISVFSDSFDIGVMEFLKHFEDFGEVIIFPNLKDIEDLSLMSKYQNIICSNSSFSWWASLIGGDKSKIVVPNIWFKNFQNHDDIYRPEFIKINV